MKIAVLVKIVPKRIEFDIAQKRIIRSKETIINPNDLLSIGAAIFLKEKNNATVTTISMGPESVAQTYKKVFDFGVDRAILLSDKLFANSDVYATSVVLSKGIQKFVNDFDLVFASDYSVDGNTALLGGSIAKFLNIPYFSHVFDFNYIEDGSISIFRENNGFIDEFIGMGRLFLSFSPKYDKIALSNLYYIFNGKKDVEIYSNGDLGIDEQLLGLNGSKTLVEEVFSYEVKSGAKNLIKENGHLTIINFLTKEELI
ncbi:MAG: hypothetical protein K6343_01930 [Caldisericaceae bacterium]